MSYDQSYTADVQAIAVVHSAGMPDAARKAEASLAALHRDIPEIAKFTISMLGESGIDVGASKATSHRLTDALMRETAVRPQGRLTDAEKLDVSKSVLRSVLVQEAAGHEYEARTGNMDTYRQWMGDRTTANGQKAMERLEIQKVDTVALYGQASDQELTMMSVGAFNRTGQAQQERTAKALGVPMPDMQWKSAEAPSLGAQAQAPEARRVQPIRGPVTRHPHGDVRRAPPAFGRRMTPSLAVAGQGM